MWLEVVEILIVRAVTHLLFCAKYCSKHFSLMIVHEVNDVSVPGLQIGDWDTEKLRNFPQGLSTSALEPRFTLRQSGLTLQYNTT